MFVDALGVDIKPLFATGSDHYVQIHAPDLTISAIDLVLDRARHHR